MEPQVIRSRLVFLFVFPGWAVLYHTVGRAGWKLTGCDTCIVVSDGLETDGR